MEQTKRFLRHWPAKTLVLAALLVGLTAISPAQAAIRRHPPAATAAHITPMPAGATDPDKDAALIVDGATGKVLYARNELLERHPASLTKMMTLYLLFDALKAGKITMQTQMPVSVHAQQQKPTKLSLRHGQTIDVDTAIRAIVIRSANDVAVVISEALGGTESHFAEMMNDKARQLGMRETNYHNASGLPDPLQITTASDLAMLARHLAYDFPQYFPYFGTSGFTYKGTYYPTHDNLIGRYAGADGIKTGYVGASGFNLATSVVRGDIHLIGIVMGGRTAVRRDQEMMHLMDSEFADLAVAPGLVAHAQVPWQSSVAAAATAPSAGTFALAPPAGNNNTKFASLSPLPADADEDAAEAHRAPDENFVPSPAAQSQSVIAAAPPPPVPAVQAPAVPRAPIPSIRPTPRPEPALLVATAAPAPQRVAMVVPAAKPSPRPQQTPAAPAVKQQVAMAAPPPALRPNVSEIDATGGAATNSAPGQNWTIQVGAFANQTMANAQLEQYAAKAKDIIGQAARIVAPIQSSNGHMLYRARFGPFAEREARDVCGQLTQRGQSCFPVVAR